jgi:ubiquinone/menaquinone biosynthesis C-methylase UbiE
MKYTGSTYVLDYDAQEQQINFEGVFRPSGEDEVAAVFKFMTEIHDQAVDSLRLNFRRLRYINAEGVKVLSLFVAYARGRDRLTLKIVVSSVLAWSERVLPNLRDLWDRIEFSVYDTHFYESQDIIEDQEFIPLLLDQNRILWPQEKEILRKHGLTHDLKIADICCGCGDLSLMMYREFKPGFMLGIDHSEDAIEYARDLQAQFGAHHAEFQRGDATALLLEDDSFDFVTCRLSLEVFSTPDHILKELIRITKPGGRIYITSEDYDMVVGSPEEDAISHTYDLAAEYGEQIGMDMRHGKKLFGMLALARLQEIRTDYIVVDTTNTDREAFARMIESWRIFSVFTIGNQLRLSQAEKDDLMAGYDAHLRTIRNPNGYTAWVMVAASGRKPLRQPEVEGER